MIKIKKCAIKNAFTMLELILSLIVMAGVAVGAINFVFKKQTNPKNENTKERKTFVCNEDSALYNSTIGGCLFYLTEEMKNSEFFEIKLIGGGGGASSSLNGENGEERSTIYSSLLYPFETSDFSCGTQGCIACNNVKKCLKCANGYKLDNSSCKINFYYKLIPGAGGVGGNSPKDGGMTSVVVMEKNSTDGIAKTSDKVLGVLETASGGIPAGNSELMPNATSSENNFGSGGVFPNNNGKSGEVIILW